MHVIPKDRSKLAAMRGAILRKLDASRFTAKVEPLWNELKLTQVRLKESKYYCGQHPGPCLAAHPREKPRRSRYLEGLDWVAWNDMLNDVLDRYSWEADIWSVGQACGRMRVRLGKRRRWRYRATWLKIFDKPFMVWLSMGDEEDFEDWCGKKAPPAEYPEGTPGVAQWKKKRVK